LAVRFQEEWEALSRCQFQLRRFNPYPALVAREANSAGWVASCRYRGQSYDARRFRMQPRGWDHEHCYLCMAHILVDDVYWENLGKDEVCLCDLCHQHFGPRLRRGAEPGKSTRPQLD
jgi:hypothetical protein